MHQKKKKKYKRQQRLLCGFNYAFMFVSVELLEQLKVFVVVSFWRQKATNELSKQDVSYNLDEKWDVHID